jgi:hypothetical protein
MREEAVRGRHGTLRGWQQGGRRGLLACPWGARPACPPQPRPASPDPATPSAPAAPRAPRTLEDGRHGGQPAVQLAHEAAVPGVSHPQPHGLADGQRRHAAAEVQHAAALRGGGLHPGEPRKVAAGGVPASDVEEAGACGCGKVREKGRAMVRGREHFKKEGCCKHAQKWQPRGFVARGHALRAQRGGFQGRVPCSAHHGCTGKCPPRSPPARCCRNCPILGGSG